MRPPRYVVYVVCLAIVLLLVFYFNQPILSYFATLGETLFHGHRSNITIYVPNNYTSIQAAVDSAIAGDTICVAAGTYLEEVVVNKDNLKILGEDPATTTLDASLGIGLHVEADNTVISGFTIRNSGTGLSLFRSSNCSIYGNHVTLNKFGILLSYASSCRVYENNVTDNEHNIRLDFSTDNYLANNTISSNHYNFGMYGGSLEHFIQRMDKSNTVNGKPICYFTNAANLFSQTQIVPTLRSAR